MTLYIAILLYILFQSIQSAWIIRSEIHLKFSIRIDIRVVKGESTNSPPLITKQYEYHWIDLDEYYQSVNELISIKVATGSSSFGFGLGLVSNFENIWWWFGSGICDNLSVWFWFVPTEPENHFSKVLQLFSEIFFQIRISQNLMLKTIIT